MNDAGLKKIQFLNGFQLKLIAILTMVVDHTGVILFPGNLVFRYIGRISFPIFAFLLVEGFVHTKNIRKYILRMSLFAIISEIPYDLAFHQSFLYLQKQNVFLTLALGLLMLYGLSLTKLFVEKASIIAIAFFLASILACDYGYLGLLLILVYYAFRDKRVIAAGAGALWNLLWNKVLFVQIYGMIAAIPIIFYNGKQGRKMKYLFYVFYPAHLICLYLIRRLYF